MFNFLRWSSATTTTQGPPPPPPPPSAILPSAIPGATVAAQSIELVDMLMRIESKLDIIITKLDSSEKKPMKFHVKPSTETPTITTTTQNPFGSKSFLDELVHKVEELKQYKHMGESHGFGV